MIQGVVPRTCGRLRPLIYRLSSRGFCKRRNIPVIFPRRFDGLWSDMFRSPVSRHFRELDNHFEDAWRRMERMMLYNFPELSARAYRDAGARVSMTDKHFEVELDIHHFDPSELKVTLAGNRLTVIAKHEQKEDQHGYIKREFNREFRLPDNIDTDTLTSSLSKDGVLTFQAEVKVTEKEPDRVIEIQRGPADDKSKA